MDDNFFNIEKLGQVTIQTVAEEYQVDSVIRSDGAFALDIYNVEDTPAELIINSIRLNMLQPGNIAGAIVPSPTSHIHLPGTPGVNRDDEIEIEFGKVVTVRKIIVLFHRVVHQVDPIDFVARQRGHESTTR